MKTARSGLIWGMETGTPSGSRGPSIMPVPPEGGQRKCRISMRLCSFVPAAAVKGLERRDISCHRGLASEPTHQGIRSAPAGINPRRLADSSGGAIKGSHSRRAASPSDRPATEVGHHGNEASPVAVILAAAALAVVAAVTNVVVTDGRVGYHFFSKEEPNDVRVHMTFEAAGRLIGTGVNHAAGAVGSHAHQAVGKKRATFADGTQSYLDGVYERTIRNHGETSRPDGRMLPVGPDVFVFSLQGHQRRVSRDNLRAQLELYVQEKRSHFGERNVYLGTWRKDEDYILDLSLSCEGLLHALLAGAVNGQEAVYHPASDCSIAVLSAQDISYVAGATCCQPRVVLADTLACLDASLLASQRDVYSYAATLIDKIKAADACDLTDEFITRVQAVRNRADPLNESYSGLLGVCIAHTKQRRTEAKMAADRRETVAAA